MGLRATKNGGKYVSRCLCIATIPQKLERIEALFLFFNDGLNMFNRSLFSGIITRATSEKPGLVTLPDLRHQAFQAGEAGLHDTHRKHHVA